MITRIADQRDEKTQTHNMTFSSAAIARFCLLLHRTVTGYVALHTTYTIVAYTTINNLEHDTAKQETAEKNSRDSQL